ncbi:MAG: sugar porter family MFS transporter [Bacteroidota bacterium]
MNNKLFIILIAAVASIGGLLFGYDTGVINGTQFYFSKYFNLTDVQKGWAVSSAVLGCLGGALVAGPLSKVIGRKNSLIVSALLFTLSAWGSGLPSFLPQTLDMLVFFRIIGGIGIGIASINAPMYIAEIAPARQRGNLVTYYQLAIVTGFFVVFLATYFIGNNLSEAENIESGWRVMFWSELIPCFLFLILLFLVPKSPRWLALKQRMEEARTVLVKIHGEEMAIEEEKEINKSIEKEGSSEGFSIFAKGILPLILIGSILSILQQTTGINAVLYYGADIFEKALGFGQEDVLEQQILLAAVNFIFTFIAMFSVDKLGRKPLVIIGCIGMIIGFMLLGVTLKTGNVGVVSLIGILVFIGSFAMSMGPITWVLLAEMFPNRVRSVILSIAVAAQWAGNYMVSQTFPIIAGSEVNATNWNGSLPYFLFSIFLVVLIGFTLKYIPETKGRSLESLEEIWESKFGAKF